MKWTLVRYRAKPGSGRREPAPERRGVRRAAAKGAGRTALRGVPAARRYVRPSRLAGGRRHAVVRPGNVPRLLERRSRALRRTARRRPADPWSATTECSQPTRSTEGDCIMQHEIVSREEWLVARTALLGAEKKLAEARTSRGRPTPHAALTAGREGIRIRHAGRPADAGRPVRRTRPADRLSLHVRAGMAGWLPGLLASWPTISTAWTSISRATTRPSSRSRGRRSTRSTDYRQRKGWRFTWVSSHPCDFNYDYQASFRPEEVGHEAVYGFELLQDRSPGPARHQRVRPQPGRRGLSRLLGLHQWRRHAAQPQLSRPAG